MQTFHVTVSSREGYRNEVRARGHALLADEPAELGGADAGPTPWELALGAMGGCTSITLRMYAQRKGWPLDAVAVDARRDEDGAVSIDVELVGALDDAQVERLRVIAGKCPVVKAFSGGAPVTETVRVRRP